ncbi:hypothetical protein H9W90_05200 [Polaribacter pectinis]|uniref:DUF5362 domain-containing protein n=1 Tax=Polaribacter pectinis TaxID=2738844 RepID=A0A7G9LD18_9FLAO|nr:DUF5362 family protein [Polaribacter pectinis]QNM86517.1 hypothetical protein H9W90_05200 [Polaribacter pectinis]
MQNAITELEQLTLTSSAKSFLRETAKWCKFLSILGFVFVGIMIIASFFIGSLYNNMPQAQGMPFDFRAMMTGMYLVLGLIYIFPIYYLYQFSVKMKKALISKDDEVLAKAFEMLKSHYKFVGVLAIILLSLYVLAIVIGLIAALSSGSAF